MKFEDQFFHSFFYPFIAGVILSAAMVLLSSIIFTNNYIDKGTGDNLIDLEKKYSKVNLYSVNIIISTQLLKIQAGLNEMINYYRNLATAIKQNISLVYKIDDKDFISSVDLFHNNSYIEENKERLGYKGFWFLDSEKNLTKIKEENNTEILGQLKAFSSMLPNLFSAFTSSNSSARNFYFYFNKTELFIGFPLDYHIKIDFINITMNFKKNPVWCTNDKGEIYTTYKFKCRDIYLNIKKAKSNIFDYNYNPEINRTIFITEFYSQIGDYGGIVYTICIEFDDPISGDIAFACADMNQENLLYNLDSINGKIRGYFLINPIGFNHIFYYPLINDTAKTLTEHIFSWEHNFYLSEKTYFNNYIQKMMTSNYYNLIEKNSIFEEIYIDGKSSENQIFSINGVTNNFSIYPVILENIYGKKEHILNIIYLYDYNLYYDSINIDNNLSIKIVLECIIFIIFGSGLLYLVVLSFNILAKYIVIPIKNVNYMLKGINIGGKNRLDYLDFLKKKQDENAELLEKINMNEGKNDKNINNTETDNNNNNLNNNNDNNNNNLIDENKIQEENNAKDNDDEILEETRDDQNDYNDEIINSKIDYNKKFDEESMQIEQESTFYNFDENLLEFRSLEVNRLVKALIDLKEALILTSSDQTVEQIINYSNSESIFRNFKNKEREAICQSNIGNLHSRIMNYEIAIYHLATALQDNKLKRFLSKALSDEFDESDNLLNKISRSFNKTKGKQKINLLIEKQLSNSKDNFSQKIIGILINSRYCKLIHVYYKFFSLIRKSNVENVNGKLMNTTFHKINYYHKILIQYIYLSFIKNDLVKIGESILDYIEFLLKFKFKTSKENKNLLNINNKDGRESKRKQRYKKYIFSKIVNWLNLFDDYVSHVKDNTSLGDEKSIVDEFSHTMNSVNSGYDSESQSVFLFRVNVQRGEYLKGKFAMICKNYSDALFYFIRAAKKKSIVLDGLIQKKSLNRIIKILEKLHKKYDKYGIIRWQMNKRILEYENSKIMTNKKKYSTAFSNYSRDEKTTKIKFQFTFKKEMDIIKKEIINDLNKCEVKQAKDIVILIDFNKYSQIKNEENSENNENVIINIQKIDAFIDQTKTILDNYLSSNDRLSVFIYTKQYQIVCPLICKKQIDINNFSKDLLYYKKTIFKEKDENEDNKDEEITEKDLQKANFEIKLEEHPDFSDSGSIASFRNKDNQFTINDIVKGLIDTLNYSKNYLKMKEEIANEKYMILFTDLFNNYKISDSKIIDNFKNLENEKNIIFLLVGKNRTKEIKKELDHIAEKEEEEKMMKSILKKFDERSENIDFENMKKIRTILSSNNIIKNEIIYPNEIY